MAKAKEARKGYIIIGKGEWKLAWFKNVTLDHALKVHAKVDVSDSSIKKIWKIAHGFTVPNHLKEQLEEKK